MVSTQHKPMLALTEHMQPVNIIKRNEEVISFLHFPPSYLSTNTYPSATWWGGLRDESSSICKKTCGPYLEIHKICTCLSIRPDIVFQVFYFNWGFPGDWGRGGAFQLFDKLSNSYNRAMIPKLQNPYLLCILLQKILRRTLWTMPYRQLRAHQIYQKMWKDIWKTGHTHLAAQI